MLCPASLYQGSASVLQCPIVVLSLLMEMWPIALSSWATGTKSEGLWFPTSSITVSLKEPKKEPVFPKHCERHGNGVTLQDWVMLGFGSHFWWLDIPWSECHHGWMRALFPLFSHGRMTWRVLWVSFIRAIMSFMRVPPSWGSTF